MQKSFDHLESLGQFLGFGLRGGFGKILAQLRRERLEIHSLEKLLYRLRAHPGVEVCTVELNRLIVGLFCHERPDLKLGQARVGHYVCLEIQDPLDFTNRHIQQHTKTGGQRLQKPDVRHRTCQFDVAHSFTSNRREGHLNTAFFAHDAAMLEALVLTTQALVILHRTKQLCAEQPVALGLECAVVNGLGFLDFAE